METFFVTKVSTYFLLNFSGYPDKEMDSYWF